MKKAHQNTSTTWMPGKILVAPTSTVGLNDLRIAIHSPCITYIDNALLCNVRDAAERRSRNNAGHAPTEHPERSGPEPLHDILTR